MAPITADGYGVTALFTEDDRVFIFIPKNQLLAILETEFLSVFTFCVSFQISRQKRSKELPSDSHTEMI